MRLDVGVTRRCEDPVCQVSSDTTTRQVDPAFGIKCSEDRTASPHHHPRVPGCPHPQPSSCRLPTLVEICLSWRLLLVVLRGLVPYIFSTKTPSAEQLPENISMDQNKRSIADDHHPSVETTPTTRVQNPQKTRQKVVNSGLTLY